MKRCQSSEHRCQSGWSGGLAEAVSYRVASGVAWLTIERIWAPVYHSADAQEGPAAFRDKRPPVWTGR